MSAAPPVVIIGGGWAGLAAALELAAHDIPVTLHEAAPQLGGRARNAPFGDLTVDNGQHLLIGAYRETLRLLALMGTAEAEVLHRTRLCLKVLEGDETLLMQAPPLPAPLHLAWAQLTARGLSLGERRAALTMSLRLMLSGFTLARDISVSELLQQHHQGERISRRLWAPLCLATLNTPPERASAQLFLRVLQESFAHRRHDADLLIPKVSLGELFAQRAADFLQRRGATVAVRQRAEALHLDGERLEAVSVAGQRLRARHLILATAPRAASRLLAGHPPLLALQRQINDLGSQPITTLYLQYPPGHRLEEPMVGMSNTLSQWLFERHLCGQPGLIAVVISAEGEQDGWDHERLTRRVVAELARQFPHWPPPLSSRVIRERHATFECGVGVEARRPANATPVRGLWLAGDYTATGLPATLEGAVRSGVQCARQIIKHY
ncbi:MAG: hydroxysqualene dehydroxylase HpnE [Gammaproteobacteria bacterium]|nr:hydroxysqualene dehydroxylase HpnE [Gammaproteobacteria bacterium]